MKSDGRKGGRGICPYCKTWQNNVAYHREHDCNKRPNLHLNLGEAGEMAGVADEEIVDHLNNILQD